MFGLDNESGYQGLNRHVFKLVTGKGLKILDIGCGKGELGKALKAKGHRVYGIEISHKSYYFAKKNLDKALLGDISTAILPSDFKDFDYIIFADVIEHIYDPLAVLKKVKPLLKKGGHIIISTPNIANWLMRLKLLFGKFDYDDDGLLDKTHIRFFTLKTLKKLVLETGYSIEKIDFTPNMVFSALQIFSGKSKPAIASKESCAKDFYFKHVFPLEKLISRVNIRFFAYGFILKLKKKAK